MIKVLNIGPYEWFSPHFVYSDESEIEAYSYDPFKKNVFPLVDYIKMNGIDALNVYRGDLIRSFLWRTDIPYVEWSTEIYPLNITDFSEETVVGLSKLMHCLGAVDALRPVFHYDISRKPFFEKMKKYGSHYSKKA
jgi:hypothetical protein